VMPWAAIRSHLAMAAFEQLYVPMLHLRGSKRHSIHEGRPEECNMDNRSFILTSPKLFKHS